MEDIANRPECPDCGRLMIVGVHGWEHPYPHCDPITTRLSDNTEESHGRRAARLIGMTEPRTDAQDAIDFETGKRAGPGR